MSHLLGYTIDDHTTEVNEEDLTYLKKERNMDPKYWMAKYVALLEKYNDLLEENKKKSN
ncbi:MAG: hypothetical protein AB8B61_09665 [Cyclobacteriaceae bacterium]